jgi:Rrf2 family transcriptional regulator, iron-sulfur cluster assembly transcription factor
MMELTRKTEYAIRGMLYLAKQPDSLPAMLGDIADAMKAPRSFLAKIFQDLVKKGLARSSRGSSGGFILAKAPEQISLREIVEAMEGPIMPNQCLISEEACSLQKTCTVHPVWRRLQTVTRGILEEVTLKTLTEDK